MIRPEVTMSVGRGVKSVIRPEVTVRWARREVQ